MDMYLTDKECISLEAEMVDKYSLYGFDQDESFKAHVWLVCRNNFNETVNDNLLAEVEFKCCHETHGLIDRELVYGIDIPGNRILFKGGFSIGTWPEGTYKIKAYLWGTQIAETVCVIGSRSMHGKYPFTNLITKEKLSVVKKKSR